MKKHFLRILVVMLMACLGIGVLAACGDGEEETPPETTYTVQFSLGESHAAEGVTAPASQTGKKVGDTVTLTTLNAAEDWKFDGWSAKSGKVSGTTYTVKAADAVEDTITLTAQWAEDTPAPTTYTVEFNAGTHGTVVGDATYTEKADGASITVPTVTANKGYTFSGWKIGTKAVSGTYTVAAADATSGKITITAEYTPITYTVNFVVTKPQGATTEVQGDHDSATITIEDNTVTFPTVTLAGYLLSGWTLTDNPSETLKQGASYDVTEADLPENGDAHAITFTAKWTAEDKYTVSFDAGTTGEVSGTATYTEKADGDSITVPTVTANKGYTFSAWKLGTETVSGTYTVSAADANTNNTITITAEYTPITYNVHFVVNKPQGAEGEVEGTATDTTITIVNNTVTFPNVKFAGYDLSWELSTDPDGAAKTGTSYNVKEADLPANNVTPEITFTAKWTAVEYTVTFNIDEYKGESNSTLNFTQKVVGTEITLPTVTEKKGYVFAGWFMYTSEDTLESDATVYKVSAADANNVDEILLIAQFDYIEYTVHFDVTSGKPQEATGEVQGTHADAVVTIESGITKRVTFPTVSLEGYVVTGWKLTDDPEEALKTGATYTVTEADLPENDAEPKITFTAQWGEPDYTGIWEDFDIEVNGNDYTFEITIQSDNAGGLDVVWNESYQTYDHGFVDHPNYIIGNFQKDGSVYKMTAGDTTYTLKVNAQNQLELSKSSADTVSFKATVAYTHRTLPTTPIAEPTPGTYYVRYGSDDYTDIQYKFAAEGNDTIKTSASGSEIVITLTAVGNYLIVEGNDVETHALYRLGGYFTTLANNGTEIGALTQDTPPLKVEDADITIRFESSVMRAASPQNMPTQDLGTKHVGDSFNLPDNTPTDQNGKQDFLYWVSKSGEHYAPSAAYEVAAEDADAIAPEGTITGYEIVFTAEWTLNYTVEYISLNEKGEKGTTYSKDANTYKTNQPITINVDDPTNGEDTFKGWQLYTYGDYMYTPVRAVKDTLYHKNDTYTPNNTEDGQAKLTVQLAFVAQWESEEEPTTDINGVWTNEGNTLTVKVEGDAGHAIMKDGSTYTYFALTGEEGTYSGSNTSGQSITIAPAGADLAVTISYGFGNPEPVTYTRESDLPAALVIEGTYEGSDGYDSVTIDFTAKTVDGTAKTFEDVGDYIVIKFSAYMSYLVYQNGGKYYVIMGDLTFELKQQGGGTTEPAEASDYVGVWTKGADDGSSVTIALDEDGETLHAVVYTPATEAPTPAYYAYYKLTADENGFAGKALNDADVTFSLQGDELTVTIGTASTTYTGKTAELPEAITIEGIYTFGDRENSAVIDFEAKTLDMGAAMGGLLPVTFVNVGKYLVPLMTVNAGGDHEQEINFVIYEDSNEYYVSVTGTAPMKLTLLTFTATGYTGDTPLYFYGGGLKEGEVLTFRGDMKFTGSTSDVKYGILGYLSQGNYLNADTETKEYIACRLDYYFYNTAADKGKAQPAAGEFGDGTYNQGVLAELKWNLSKLSLGFTVGSDDWFAAYNAMIAQANTTFGYELEYDYSMKGVVFISYIITTPTQFTYTFNTTQVTVPAGTQFIVRYGVEPYDDGNLDNLVVAIGGEQATLTNISISKTEPLLHFHKKGADDACEICGKTLTNGAEQTLTLTNNDQRQNWMQHIANQTTGTYTATANTELHVTGEFGTVGADWEGFAIVVMETTSKQGLFCQYSSGSCRNSNWTTWVGAPWNLEKRTVNGGFANLDTLAATTKSGHKFELVLTYDGTLAKLAIITYADDNGTAADTRIITFNIEGSALAIGIGFDGTGGNTDNVKNVKYYTVTATDPAPAAD